MRGAHFAAVDLACVYDSGACAFVANLVYTTRCEPSSSPVTAETTCAGTEEMLVRRRAEFGAGQRAYSLASALLSLRTLF